MRMAFPGHPGQASARGTHGEQGDGGQEMTQSFLPKAPSLEGSLGTSEGSLSTIHCPSLPFFFLVG